MKIGIRERFRYYVRDIFKNRWKAVLSIVGIMLALVIMLTGNFMMDSYYNARFSKIQYLKRNSIIYNRVDWNSESEDITDKIMSKFRNVFGDSYLMFRKGKIAVIRNDYVKDDKKIKVSMPLFGTNGNFDGSIVRNENGIEKSKLLAGRGISDEDVENKKSVIVVGSIVADIMFGGDAVGKTVMIPRYVEKTDHDGRMIMRFDGYDFYEVVGVYQNTRDEYRQFTQKVSETETASEYVYESMSFVPVTCDIGESYYRHLDLIYSGVIGTESDYSKINSELEDLRANYSFVTYEVAAEEIRQEMGYIHMIINAVTVILMLISSFVMVLSMVFSVKENISEYGVKKALGATDERIAFGIFAETMGYGVLAYVIAFGISVLLTYTGLYILRYSVEYAAYTLVINGKTIVAGFLLAILSSCFAGLIPTIYMSKKNIVEVIKFE